MRIVIALGGNAILRRGQPLEEYIQHQNVRAAARTLTEIIQEHEVIVTHGSGPQIGLLALQAAAYTEVHPYPLDVLGAEAEGMIGYRIEQELRNHLQAPRQVVTLLTQIEVDPNDPALEVPSKPIGPLYSEEEAARLTRKYGWVMAPEQGKMRRVVPSPSPLRILEMQAIRLLVDAGITVICAGSGGIPVVRQTDGYYGGVEVVIDKDRASALLAEQAQADVLLLLTDVDALYEGWGTPHARAIQRVSPEWLQARSFASGSMGPKVEAACAFVRHTNGRAVIGSLEQAPALLRGECGTTITNTALEVTYHPHP
uniref:Carbamate kinase n=1 Tax=Thermosporothrix sp. COM3 TaxID=2490863 RepID=A0A455SPV9_9CHLR|nr:carbamate kinase [Thermosporothrix sp. COM3]